MGLFDFLFGGSESCDFTGSPQNSWFCGERRNGGKPNEQSEFFFASQFRREDFRSMSEDRRHRASGSSNWTSREDWDFGDYDSDGMSGFDSYEDNDF